VILQKIVKQVSRNWKTFATSDQKGGWEQSAASGRHSAQSAFRPTMFGIRPTLGSFH